MSAFWSWDGTVHHSSGDESCRLLEIDVRRLRDTFALWVLPASVSLLRTAMLIEVAMCQNLMILAGLGGLRTRLALDALPPLLQRSLSKCLFDKLDAKRGKGTAFSDQAIGRCRRSWHTVLVIGLF